VYGPVYEFLARDHARLDALLLRAVAHPEVLDGAAYAEFRAGLLRHIAMEEKVLLPDARRRRGEPLPIAKQLREDHALLASLMVPTPTHELVAVIREVLEQHNPLEEGPDGVYAVCEQLAGPDAQQLLHLLRATPEVPVAQHVDGPRVQAHISRQLAARSARKSADS
jgi:hypothetical protein